MIVPILIAFITSLISIPIFNKFFNKIGVLGVDIMKENKPQIVDMGGPGVVSGFVLGIFFYIGTIIWQQRIQIRGKFIDKDIILLIASITTILIIELIGIFETLTSLIKKEEQEDIFKTMKEKVFQDGYIF